MDIPIPQYPPFKLRLSLIDKDPVIWVHLLEHYIQLFQWLCLPAAQPLSVKSQQDLHQFLRLFLLETLTESTQIFSLGAINPEIVSNQAALRAQVFQYLKLHSLAKCGLMGELVWHFATVYAPGNITTVRGLIDGTFTSKLNDNKKLGRLSSIGGLHKYWEQKITKGEVSSADLTTLSTLIGQQIGFSQTILLDSAPVVQKLKKLSTQFAASFVNIAWIELLEKLWNKGSSVHALEIANIMVLSLFGLLSLLIALLCQELGVNNASLLRIFPLFGSILLAPGFQEMVSNLENQLPWLKSLVPGVEVNEEDVATLHELFPELEPERARQLLAEYENVEVVTDMLFETPLLMAMPPKPLEKVQKIDHEIAEAASNRFSLEKVVVHGKQKQQKSGDLKRKTLEAALLLMYEAAEDEPDDTYQDQEKTTGAAFETKGRRNQVSRIEVVDDPNEGAHDFLDGAKPTSDRGELLNPDVDPIDSYLFDIMKRQGVEAFEKGSRKLSERQAMKLFTKWSDEQLEGWYRMLTRLPRRFRMLEENYLFSRPNVKGDKPQKAKKKKPAGGAPQAPTKTPKHKKKSHHKPKNTAPPPE